MDDQNTPSTPVEDTEAPEPVPAPVDPISAQPTDSTPTDIPPTAPEVGRFESLNSCDRLSVAHKMKVVAQMVELSHAHFFLFLFQSTTPAPKKPAGRRGIPPHTPPAAPALTTRRAERRRNPTKTASRSDTADHSGFSRKKVRTLSKNVSILEKYRRT